MRRRDFLKLIGVGAVVPSALVLNKPKPKPLSYKGCELKSNPNLSGNNQTITTTYFVITKDGKGMEVSQPIKHKNGMYYAKCLRVYNLI